MPQPKCCNTLHISIWSVNTMKKKGGVREAIGFFPIVKDNKEPTTIIASLHGNLPPKTCSILKQLNNQKEHKDILL